MGSSQHKAYIPDTARDNQYILAELQVSEALLQHYTDQLSCYQQLSHQFFVLAQQAGLRNVHFIANDKLPVVRFHTKPSPFKLPIKSCFSIIRSIMKPNKASLTAFIAPEKSRYCVLPPAQKSAITQRSSISKCNKW
ncbi:MAG: DUF3083 family protein [Rheinheimera sp.]|nr:DUF3083 family protein [Rheinheimera sp.]